MKIWRGTYRDPHEGTCYVWKTSERKARTALAALINDMEGVPSKDNHDVKQIDIPTTHTGLADWLTIHFSKDNG